jgi:hypothetical protein
MASHWRGRVWVATEFNFSGDGAHGNLQHFPALLISYYSSFITHMFTHLQHPVIAYTLYFSLYFMKLHIIGTKKEDSLKVVCVEEDKSRNGCTKRTRENRV